MALKGYQSYRGRQGIWRRITTVLLVLILLASCAFLFLQRYITYSDDGSFRLDLPFLIFDEKSDDAGNDAGEKQDVNLVITPPEESGKPEEEKTAQNDEPPKETGPVVDVTHRLLMLSALPKDEAALTEILAAAGADGFVFTVKDNTGKVFHDSQVAISQAVGANAVSRELLGTLCAQSGVYTVAKINCFHDSYYAFRNMAAAGICQQNGYIWNDYLSWHWLEPEKEAARRYVIDLALECAQLGFDELLLEEMCYPARGRLDKIDYSGNTMERTEALVFFMNELRSALDPYGVRISLMMDEDEILGTAEDVQDTGLAADRLLHLVDAVYTVTQDLESTQRAVSAVVGDEIPPVVVPIVSGELLEDKWCLLQ